MHKIAKFARENYGYALAFAVGAVFNHYVFGSSNEVTIPEWVTWIPSVVFVVVWIALMRDSRKSRGK